MAGNRHPFRVGPVREAYWGTLGPIIPPTLSNPRLGRKTFWEVRMEKDRGRGGGGGTFQ